MKISNLFSAALVSLAAIVVSCGPKPLVPAEKGAFETRKYRNVFVEAGYSPKAVEARLNQVFEEVFFGPDKVYFEVEDSLAMPIFTGGAKAGFDRSSFVRAFVASGIQEVTANKLIDKMAGHKDNWVDIIHSSFLPEELKSEYVAMIEQRVGVLMQNC